MMIRRSNHKEVENKKEAFKTKYPTEYKKALALNIKNDFGRNKLTNEEVEYISKVNAMMVEFGIEKGDTFSIIK